MTPSDWINTLFSLSSITGHCAWIDKMLRCDYLPSAARVLACYASLAPIVLCSIMGPPPDPKDIAADASLYGREPFENCPEEFPVKV